jgi:Flp pilus assembly protein TadB
MTAGIILIFAGILLVLYPPLLAIIVATVLIASGALLMAVTWYERKLQRHYQNPTIEFVIRH